jgi:hypothetical protein
MTNGIKELDRMLADRDPLVTARLPKEMIAAIESWAAKKRICPSDAIRQLIEAALATEKSPQGRE